MLRLLAPRRYGTRCNRRNVLSPRPPAKSVAASFRQDALSERSPRKASCNPSPCPVKVLTILRACRQSPSDNHSNQASCCRLPEARQSETLPLLTRRVYAHFPASRQILPTAADFGAKPPCDIV